MLNNQGSTVRFRLASSDDAGFIYGLRTNPRFNEHLSEVNSGVESQRQWLINYKSRELVGEEYYFIIERIDTGISIGTVRLYDFINGKESFCWGSWILNENKTRCAAIESAMLVYELGFKFLGFKSCHFDVRKQNIKVIDFHEKMGAVQVSEGETDIFYKMSMEAYKNFYSKNSKFLESR